MRELGDLIRAAREAKHVSLEQAAAETRIRRAYLDAIEDGDFRIFPGKAYATGFLRNYSTYLGLNADEILQTYHAMAPQAGGITIAPATTVGVERLRRKSRRRTLWTAAVIMLLALCGYAIKSYSTPPPVAAGHLPKTPKTTPSIPNQVLLNRDRNADQPPSAVIRIKAVDTAWVRIMATGHQVYWGPIHKGTSKKFRGGHLKLVTHRSSAFKIWIDGIRAWHISKIQGKVGMIAGPYGRRLIHPARHKSSTRATR